jgi:type 1 glutamine amidotransferase
LLIRPLTIRYRWIIFILLALALQCTQGTKRDTVRILVVTGGHAYDTAEFEQMFRIPGIETGFGAKPAAWQKIREEGPFDVLVFYDMYQEISAEEKEIFLGEFERGTGMVFLHHSLGSHQDWPEYAGLVGGRFYTEEYAPDTSQVLDYYHDLNLHVRVVDRDHPVTRGVGDYDVIDEGYVGNELKPGLHYLLETDDPKCDRYVGWAHEVKNSRVVYLMGGHDRQAYENEAFSRLVENAIRWTSQK